MKITSDSPEHTQQLGREMGREAQAGDVFLLMGGLGAGKTCLVQGIAWGLGARGYATSPSFVIVKEYQGRLPLYHIDLYRVEKEEELLELGLEDYFVRGGVCAVEWAEKGGTTLPEEHLFIRIEFISDTRRSLYFEPKGKRYEAILSRLSCLSR